MDGDLDRSIINAGVSGLAELYRTGATTPDRAVDLYFARISAFDDKLGAFVHLREAEAREEAAMSTARWARKSPLSPVDGVPIAVKANIAVAGSPWHAGIRAYGARIAPADADSVATLRGHGAIVMGLLNMDEGALGARGDNPWLGRTHNPYRHGFTAGGSSSGAGAAVAAGLCAAALGTDTMGSVRIPAAFCGCSGYKPSRGAIPLGGVVPLSPTLDHVGLLGRSVEDCAMLCAAATATAQPFHRLAAKRPRLGLPIDMTHAGIDVEIERALAAVMESAQAHGADIVPIDLGLLDLGRLRRACLLVVEVEAMRVHRGFNPEAQGFSAEFLKMLRWGDKQPLVRIADAYAQIFEAADFLRNLVGGVTALILPTVPDIAFPFTTLTPANLADLAVLGNVSGMAAITLPIGLSTGGLPLALQCLGLQDGGGLVAAEFLAECAGPVLKPPGWMLS
jgi:aspartyl-tRNA(Asn)/glutamyl-tRNA(Gln) amidotransferase subunit A